MQRKLYISNKGFSDILLLLTVVKTVHLAPVQYRILPSPKWADSQPGMGWEPLCSVMRLHSRTIQIV